MSMLDTSLYDCEQLKETGRDCSYYNAWGDAYMCEAGSEAI